MNILTERFGEINIEEDRVFEFELPIIGFDTHKKFIILDPNTESIFKWLQSTEDGSLAFPIISVAALNIDYSIELSDSVVNELGITNAEDVLVMNITSIPQENPRSTTINMLAPIIFNLNNHKAGQIVLSGSGYDISYPMFKDDN